MIRIIRNPAIVQISAGAGLDFIMFDLEHGNTSLERVADAALVARALGLGCFARVSELSKAQVSGALDAGCNAVMVPMIADVDEARRLVDWAKYYPLGVRGYNSSSGHSSYRQPAENPKAFFEKSNENTLSIAQIERVSAIEQIDQIAAVSGLDALLVGPNDLAVSLGIPGQLESAELDDAIGKVAGAAKKHGKVFGIHGSDALLSRWIPEGLSMIMSSLDINFITNGIKSVVEKFGLGD